MAVRKNWTTINPQLFQENGGEDGAVEIQKASLFRVGMIVTIQSDTLQPRTYRVNEVISKNKLVVGPIGPQDGKSFHERSDISDFLVADNASISLSRQARNTIKPSDITQAVYEEEPAAAIRGLLVGPDGIPIDENNPFPVEIPDGEISVTVDLINDYKISKINIPTANTELLVPVPADARRYKLRARGNAKLMIALEAGDIDNDIFWTNVKGGIFDSEQIDLPVNSRFYIASDKNDTDVEIIWWKRV